MIRDSSNHFSFEVSASVIHLICIDLLSGGSGSDRSLSVLHSSNGGVSKKKLFVNDN